MVIEQIKVDFKTALFDCIQDDKALGALLQTGKLKYDVVSIVKFPQIKF
jgi:hypothetical protein